MKSPIFEGGSNLMQIYGIVERFPLKNRVDDFLVRESCHQCNDPC